MLVICIRDDLQCVRMCANIYVENCCILQKSLCASCSQLTSSSMTRWSWTMTKNALSTTLSSYSSNVWTKQLGAGYSQLDNSDANKTHYYYYRHHIDHHCCLLSLLFVVVVMIIIVIVSTAITI